MLKINLFRLFVYKALFQFTCNSPQKICVVFFLFFFSNFIRFRCILGIATENTSNFVKNKNDSNVPPEDKYAALKDLDSQMKSQLIEKQQEELKQKLGE